MDAVDLIAILLRRWFVVLPVLLLAGGGALFMGERIAPEYTAQSALVLLPPATGDPERGAINPYRTMGSDNTISSVEIVSESPDARRQAASAGHTTNYTISTEARSNVVLIDAVSGEPEEAVGTVAFVQQLMINTLGARQEQVPGLDVRQRFVFDQLAAPDISLVEVPGKARTQVAVLGAGVLLAIGSALLADRLLSRPRPGGGGRAWNLGRATSEPARGQGAIFLAQRLDPHATSDNGDVVPRRHSEADRASDGAGGDLEPSSPGGGAALRT